MSPDVSEVLLEKEGVAKSLQDDEEQARLQASTFITPSVETQDHSEGTLGETLDASARWGKTHDDDHLNLKVVVYQYRLIKFQKDMQLLCSGVMVINVLLH